MDKIWEILKSKKKVKWVEMGIKDLREFEGKGKKSDENNKHISKSQKKDGVNRLGRLEYFKVQNTLREKNEERPKETQTEYMGMKQKKVMKVTPLIENLSMELYYSVLYYLINANGLFFK